MRRSRFIVILLFVLGTLIFKAVNAPASAGDSLSGRIALIRHLDGETELDCNALAAKRPLVLLALGQSNAGNHGATSQKARESVILVAGGKCVLATDPLPGATGDGGSIWSRLPRLLRNQGLGDHPVIISVLAVDATTLGEWTNPESPLAHLLLSHLATMKRLALPPDAILWQQGEADARKGTHRDEYLEGLKKLSSLLSQSGTDAPILLARSTRCQAPPNDAIRQALDVVPSIDSRFRRGPDTDTLAGETYRTGCHMTVAGLESAARMWASAIAMESFFQEKKKEVPSPSEKAS